MGIRLLAGLILLVPGLAFAQNWSFEPDGGGDVASLKPNQVAYFDFANTTDSRILDVSACNTVTIHFDPDEDGTNTGAEVHIREASERGLTCSGMDLVAVDRDGDGQITAADELTLTGNVGRRGFRNIQVGPQVCVDVTLNGSSDDARVTIQCKE